MEVLVILFFIILLFVILSFKRSVNRNIEKLSHDLWQMREELAKQARQPKPADPKPTPPPATEPKIERPYWETGFQPVETTGPSSITIPETKKPPLADEPVETVPAKTEIPAVAKAAIVPPRPPVAPPPPPSPGFFERHPDLEKFIGENLINKIGIGILVLAIGFFVKYAIDNNWIGPVGRVGIGIADGGILVGLAHRLRVNYKAFSSVLAGGGLAIFYFTITLAYHQFHLFNQLTSFIIMAVITAFAVLLSILYDRQELAIIALVGGFATPFMVSNNSGNYQVLFTYMLVLNTGLLVIAYFKGWRLLNILSFIFTVLLVAGWLWSLTPDVSSITYRNGLVFATAFYLLFFAINIAYNVKENKRFIASDFGILLINTSLYFAAGLYFINAMHADNYRGLFSASMGIFNLVASFLLFRKQQTDKNILYLLVGITFSFVSLTAPLQLHGNYITLFWASEAVLLYWLYQRSSIGIIRYSSFIIWVAMLLSLLMDWFNIYYKGISQLTMLFNKGFVTGIYSVAATWLLFRLTKKQHAPIQNKQDAWPHPAVFGIAGLLLLYCTGVFEIAYQFAHSYPNTGIYIQYIYLYTYLFVLTYVLLTTRVARLQMPWQIAAVLITICLFLYLMSIQESASLLRSLTDQKIYTGQLNAHWPGTVTVAVLFALLIPLLRNHYFNLNSNAIISWLLCAWTVVFLSYELHLANNQRFYTAGGDWHRTGTIFQKTVLPILWGLCSFIFMWLGMRYKFRTLRIISLALFTLTLLKLFVFDIRNIPAGGKIAAFFCLGVLLLVVSFMYQRLKRIIIEDEKKESV